MLDDSSKLYGRAYLNKLIIDVNPNSDEITAMNGFRKH